MKKIKSIFIIFVLISSMALAIDGILAKDNTVESSTMYFEGELTRNADGSYSGTISAIPGKYYVPGGPGADISTGGGFDLFAKEGGRAYIDNYYLTGPWNYGGTDTFRIGYFGDSHDAYPSETGGGPWGSFYDPDVPDYDSYQLTLKDNKWYLQFKNAALATPMSGNVDWSRMYAYETDIGSYKGIATPKYPGRAAANGGGIQAWDMDWTWGSEVIPLEYPGFKIAVTPATDGKYLVSLTPAENPVKKSLPIDKFLKILQKNRCKNHPDLEGCKVIATENYVRLDGTQFKQLIENKEDIYLIDVRTEQMYSDGYISGAVNIPYSKLGDMISTIPKDRKVVLYCKTGQTSIKSAEFLVKNNFDNIYVVTDGYDVLLGLGIK